MSEGFVSSLLDAAAKFDIPSNIGGWVANGRHHLDWWAAAICKGAALLQLPISWETSQEVAHQRHIREARRVDNAGHECQVVASDHM